MTDKTLGEIADITMGQSPPGVCCNKTGEGIALLNGPFEFGEHHPEPVQFTTSPKKYAYNEDLLFCVRGSTTGRMNWSDQTYAIGRGIAAIRSKHDWRLNALIRGFIEVQLPHLLQAATGSTFPNVSSKQLANLPVPDWGRRYQLQVSEIIGAFDQKIKVNYRMNEKLEEMARTIFKDWFVEFGPVRAKMERREPYLSREIWDLFPDRFDDKGLPLAWERTTLGELAELRYGKALKAQDRKNGSIPVYGSNGLVDWHNTPLVEGPGVVIGRKGNAGAVTYVEDDFFCIDTTFFVRPLEDQWDVRFLRFLLERLHLAGLAADSAVPGLNRNIAYSAECIKPDCEVVKCFAEIVSPFLRRIARNNNENATLASIRDQILPKLISGAVSVDEAENYVAEAV